MCTSRQTVSVKLQLVPSVIGREIIPALPYQELLYLPHYTQCHQKSHLSPFQDTIYKLGIVKDTNWSLCI